MTDRRHSDSQGSAVGRFSSFAADLAQIIVTSMPSVAAAIAAVASQPNTRHTVGSAKSPTVFGCDAAIITATMIGTEMAAFATAAQ